jgi:hypothetical protein
MILCNVKNRKGNQKIRGRPNRQECRYNRRGPHLGMHAATEIGLNALLIRRLAAGLRR